MIGTLHQDMLAWHTTPGHVSPILQFALPPVLNAIVVIRRMMLMMIDDYDDDDDMMMMSTTTTTILTNTMVVYTG